MRTFQQLMLVALVLVSSLASAQTFRPTIDQSRWQLESSRFECVLSQQIPLFGTGRFLHEAGERVRFSLTSKAVTPFGDNVRLLAEPSVWQGGRAPWAIGQVSAQPDADVLLRVQASESEQMLAALFQGMSPTVMATEQRPHQGYTKVGLSSANFQAAYREYKECVAQLLPVNYRQIARTAVLFPSGQWRLSDATRERLDLIALYVQTDESVRSIYVDGHSDAQGRRLLNRDLSKQRAEAVTEYLKAKGIDESMITMRYHGERYPVVANNSPSNRTRNRRVTIRLERE